MAGKAAAVLLGGLLLNSDLSFHVEPVLLHSRIDEGKVEEIAVVCHEDSRFDLLDMIEKPAQHCKLIFLIKTGKRPLVFLFGRILKILNIRRHNLAVDDQKPFAINHIRNHINRIILGIWKL